MRSLAVALVDSLLSAMVRADGDALVMHVGERPIVVSGSRTVDLSNHGMNLGAMVGMLSQLLSLDAQAVLRDLGAVEHELPSRESDRFSVVAARSGDDIWIEIRRRREALSSAGQQAALPGESDALSETPDPPAQDAAQSGTTVDTDEPPAIEPPATELPASEPPAVDGAEPPAASTVLLPSDDPAPPLDASEPMAAAGEPGEPPIETAEAESDATDHSSEPPSDPSQGDLDTSEEAAEVVAADVVEERLTEDAPSITPIAAADEPGPAEAGSTDAAMAEDEPRPEIVPEPLPVEADAPAAIEHGQEAGDVAAPIAAVASQEVGDEVPASTEASVPAFASAATGRQSGFTLVSGSSMDAAHHQGHSAGEPPLESAAPVTSSDALPPAGSVDHTPRLPDVPVTRTVRIEVPARSSSARASGIDRLLRAADAAGASELFLVSQSRPYVRVGGNVRPLQDEPMLLGSDIETLIADVTPEPWRDAVRRGDPADWLIELPEIGRVRCASFRDHRGPGANFHFAFLRAATADDLQLNAETRRLATEPDGLVLVSGAAGSEMAAIIAAFVDLLNQQRADYIVTLEPQVRNLHVNREALISQREVGTDPVRAAGIALAALREQPDVLVIESIASGELAQLAIDAAAQHRLVIVSIEAASAPAAVQRLIELVPEEHRQHARHQLSRCFRGAVAQLMLRKSTGGKIAARELLTSTGAVTRLLADGELSRLADQLETAGATGLAPIADTVVDYVRSGLVDVREAVRKAPDAARLVDRLRTAGADLSALDGWN